VLTFEMDRQTPFKADQVYFDYRIAERDATGKSLKVNLNVVPRAQLDTELAALSACGVTLDGVDCWQSGSGSGRAGLNLLPQERRAKRKNQRLRLNLALGATAIVLLVIAMLQFLANRQDALDAMTGEVAKAQTEAKQTAALTKKLQDNTASANYLFRMKQDTTTMTEMLADLTKRLPDDTFLERLTVDDKGKVDVQGQSSNAAKLIEGLQKSDVLSNPGFTGTIQKDPRTGKERFNLSIETRKHPADDVPPKDGKPADKSSGETPDKRTEAANAPST
jgi:general secretion pathway protein L